MRRPLLALALALALPATALAHDDNDQHTDGRDISKVNGGISAEAGRSYGDLSTVNGGIKLRDGSSAEDVETVNGGINVEDDVQMRSVQTVNGGIHAGERVRVEGAAETVNGGVSFDFHSRVGGDISTVNGSILVKQTDVGGKISTVGGDITVGAKSVVRGGIRVEKQRGVSWGKQRTPRIVIGPDATVNGALVFEREVELFVHPRARIGAVTGATAQSWTDTLPPRRDD